MKQTDDDIQLNIWRELAISKQMLMRAATDALKLDPECSQEALKEALEALVKKLANADTDAAKAKAESTAAISALEKKLATTEQALAASQAAANEAKAGQEAAVQQVAQQRAAATMELQKVKDRLAEREKALKAINVALADTPANVLQKMNQLKKQKQEEANGRRDIEAALNSLRAEKRQQDQKLTELQKNGTTLATRHRELHALSVTLLEQLQPLAADPKALPKVPELDTTLLESIETSADAQTKRPAQLRAVNS